jgi:hypothetical protein
MLHQHSITKLTTPQSDGVFFVPWNMVGTVRTSNKAERIAAKKLQKQGYEVLKNGWPDFIAVNWETKEIKFIEIKPGKKKLKPRQIKMTQIFSILGLEYLVWNVDTENNTITESSATGKLSTMMSQHRKA